VSPAAARDGARILIGPAMQSSPVAAILPCNRFHAYPPRLRTVR